jgi:hypothetical protein
MGTCWIKINVVDKELVETFVNIENVYALEYFPSKDMWILRYSAINCLEPMIITEKSAKNIMAAMAASLDKNFDGEQYMNLLQELSEDGDAINE